jgi:hypothetical protein
VEAVTSVVPIGNDRIGSATPRAGIDLLVGRDEELATLRAAFDAAAEGWPTIVLVIGEAGIGKTRLADEAAAMARAAGMRVLRGEADASVREPMELWRGVYRALDLTLASDPSLPAEERRWEYLESLAGVLIAAAPAVVILDDLHWADAMAVWVVEHLPRALGDAPVALVASSRDHEPDMPRLDSVRRVSRLVPLTGLDVASVRQLAAQATQAVDAIELHTRTGGNPLFVKELLRSPEGGGVIGEVLDRALTRFDSDTREVLAAAALAGPTTPLAVLAAALSTTTAAVADRLGPARRDGVVDQVTRSGVRFHHALLADAAERLADVRSLHAQLAAAWEAIGGLDGRAAAAGHRLRAAVGASEAADAVVGACDLAAELVAAEHQSRAAGLLRDACDVAVECVDRPELRARASLDLAKLLRWLGDLDLALERYQEAERLARLSSDAVLRAKAAVGAYLWANAFVPDPAPPAIGGSTRRRPGGRPAPPGQGARAPGRGGRCRNRHRRPRPRLGRRGGRRGQAHWRSGAARAGPHQQDDVAGEPGGVRRSDRGRRRGDRPR